MMKLYFFSSIDDNEVNNLKLLNDNIFGENNYIASVPRLASSQRPSQEKNNFYCQ